MATFKRIFLLAVLLLGVWQLHAQYVIIGLPVGGYLTPVCPMDSNGVSATLQVTMTPNTTWGPPSGNATFELVNVYNTSQVYSSVVAPTFPGGNSTATVTFKLPRLNADCDDTLMMQVRVTIAGASPASIYSSTAMGVRYKYTAETAMNSNPPYQDLIPFYVEHCPGVFPQPLGAVYSSTSGTKYKWQVKSGSVWSNIFGGDGYTTAPVYNTTVNGTYRCVVRSPFCDSCYTVTSDFIVKDIDSLQIAGFSPSGTSPQLYTPGMSLQRSAPASTFTFTNYQWYRNGVPVAGATNNAYVPSGKGTYTLSGYGPCGRQTSNAFVLTGDCEPSGYKMITGHNLSGGYTGKNLMSGEYIVPSGSVVTFNTADIIMLPCTRITVAGGGTLNIIRSSTLHSCMQWYGIVVSKGGTLAIDTSAISDAYIAVTGDDDNAKIDIQRSAFHDNHLCVWLRKNKTKNVQNIHDNNLFADIDITNGDQLCENIKSLASTIDPVHDYIFIDGSNQVSITRNNTFKGIPAVTTPDLFPSPVIAIQANTVSGMAVSTGNKFTDLLLDGVLMNDCSKILVTGGNQFISPAGFGNAVCLNGGYDISIDNTNIMNNYAYGVKANGGSRISVLGNSFSNNRCGISFSKLASYKVDGNTIGSLFTGMETYNDNFAAITPPPFKISNNIFQGLYQGLIISPVKNPLYAATTAENKLAAGPQNVQVLCNNFSKNTIAVTGSAPITDQYYTGQQWAGNLFDQNLLWDIAWVDSPAAPAMNYYYDATLVPYNPYIPNMSYPGLTKPAFTMNGVTVSTAFVNVIPNGNGQGNCSYDPYTNVSRYAAGEMISQSGTTVIYPNPAADWLAVDAKETGTFDYSIISLTAQTVRSGKSAAAERIRLDGIAPGMYMLKLVMTDGKVQNYRFIKE